MDRLVRGVNEERLARAFGVLLDLGLNSGSVGKRRVSGGVIQRREPGVKVDPGTLVTWRCARRARRVGVVVLVGVVVPEERVESAVGRGVRPGMVPYVPFSKKPQSRTRVT